MLKTFWQKLCRLFAVMRRDPTAYTPGQLELLQAVRLTNNKDIGKVIREASVDDLEWFLQTVKFQLRETPYHVDDEDMLATSQAWHRRVEIMTSSILHNKKVAAGTLGRLSRHGGKIFYLLLAALAAAVIALLLK